MSSSGNPDTQPSEVNDASADWAERNAFFEAIAQQVRRPLDGVVAVAELLQRQPMSADALAYVRTITEQHQLLLQTLNDACDLSRAERGALEIAPEAVELRPLMDAIQEQWQARAAQTGVALSVSYDGEDLVALIDEARVRQVFNHLIERALKLTRRGGVEASLKARREGAGIVIEGRVRDSGPPTPPEKLARIFEARMDPMEGMGMILCRRLLEAMSGSIRAESNVGAGSTIAFDFLAREAVMEKGVDIEDRAATRAAHVLVVDDNATNRMVAEALCEMFDCTSESAEDGVEAVEAASSGRFDLILMDIKMPRMDGVEATRTIRALPGPPGQVPIIALTANADPEDAAGYIASGMSSVVEKPIKPEALLAAMNACLPVAGEGSDDGRAVAAA